MNLRAIGSTPHLLFALLLALSIVTTGCTTPECEVMSACCDAVADLEGLGSACGELSAGTNDRDTCRTVVDTIVYMLEDRDRPIPNACERP